MSMKWVLPENGVPWEMRGVIVRESSPKKTNSSTLLEFVAISPLLGS